MAQATLTISTQIAGIAINATQQISGDVTIAVDQPISAGATGSLSTRTTAASGVATFTSHSIIDSDTVDIYWTDGFRAGCDVDAYDGTTVTFSGGVGDDLPDQGSTVIVTKRETLDNVAFDGDDLQAIVLTADQRCLVDFCDDTGASLLTTPFEIIAGGYWLWATGGGTVNPLADDAIDHLRVTGAGDAVTLKVAALLAS